MTTYHIHRIVSDVLIYLVKFRVRGSSECSIIVWGILKPKSAICQGGVE